MRGPDALLRQQATPLCDGCLAGSWRNNPCWRWCQWWPLRASFTSFPTRTCCRVVSGLLRRACGAGNNSSTIAMPASCTTSYKSPQRPRSSAGSAAVLQNRSMMPIRSVVSRGGHKRDPRLQRQYLQAQERTSTSGSYTNAPTGNSAYQRRRHQDKWYTEWTIPRPSSMGGHICW